MKIKTMAFREVYKLFVDAWELYRKYSARRLDDAECEAMESRVLLPRKAVIQISSFEAQGYASCFYALS